MTEALEKAFREAQALPERQQREIAELINMRCSSITHSIQVLTSSVGGAHNHRFTQCGEDRVLVAVR